VATRRRKKAKIKLANMWFFALPLAERIKYQTCRENDCNETGIFSPDSCRSWYCGKHMEENYERQVQP